jgi:hypothetical protein
MGRHAYLVGEDDYAIEWLRESLGKYEKEKEKTASIEEILQFSAFSSYKIGSSIEILFLKSYFVYFELLFFL